MSRASHLLKAIWGGPARVAAIEQDSNGNPSVIWVAHGTSLLRCSPKQVRPMVEETGHPPQADPPAALQDLQALKARSTTQFRDIAQEPDNEIHADIEDQMDDYEPSIIGEDEQMVGAPAGRRKTETDRQQAASHRQGHRHHQRTTGCCAQHLTYYKHGPGGSSTGSG